MNAPFFKYDLFSFDQSLMIAFFIGIAFGFFLERAGFGSAKKLAAQFYFYDMTVFKVMFTAIITAMLGLFWLSWFGLVNINLIYITPSYILPQLIGGLIFGAGFVMGGFCPGTCVVAMTTGKIDGVFTLIGMLFGIFLFGEAFPLISDFFYSTNLGEITFSSYFNISYGLLVFIVVLLAVAGFYAAELLEKKFKTKMGKAK